MKVLLDANILIAAFATRGLCQDLFEACLSEHEIVSSRELLGEVRRNLVKKIRLPPAVAEEVVSFIAGRSITGEVAPVEPGACRDPSDLAVLGLAVGSRCDCLVTGDQDLLSLRFFREIPILDPRGFWALLGKRRRTRR